MSLGLPVQLIPSQFTSAFARAVHVVAVVCLLSGLLYVVALQTAAPGRILWPAAIAFLIQIALIWQLDRHRTVLFTVAYLLIGGACTYWICVVAMTQFTTDASTDTFALSMTKVALVMVGGAGAGSFSAIGWSAAGFVVAEGVALIVAIQTGTRFTYDGTTSVVIILVVLMLGGISLSGQRLRAAQPSLHRAARDEHLSAVRYRIESRAAAIMHDTVLNHLAAIAAAEPGVLKPDIRDQIDRDLEQLLGEEWLVDSDSNPNHEASVEWLQSQLHRVIEESRQAGLEIDISGDVSAVNRLGAERSLAIALATKQCLVNVQKHAGTEHAELIVYGSERDVSVMVVDAGKGFSEAETGADRLGLRQSVRRRIENVGGSVQVWSTPGRGTSVIIRVPVATGNDSETDA